MAELFKQLRTLKRVMAEEGSLGVLYRLRQWLRNREENRNISAWLKEHGRRLLPEEIDEVRERIGRFQRAPLISIIMPVYDVDERWLRRAIESVIEQEYPTWELCIADDCSPSPHVRVVLEEYANRDSRIKVTYRNSNGHISAASNSALELVTGDFTGLLDHDDELTQDALFHVVTAINEQPDAKMFYSDEDGIDESGERYAPKLKPAWSRDLFYSVNYVTHFAVYRTDVLRKVGGFRPGFEGSQDYDLALRVLEEIGDEAIHHIARILYHWRAISGSVALSPAEKPYAHERARLAIREHLERCRVQAEVREASFDLHRVVYRCESEPVYDLFVSGKSDLPVNFGGKAVHLGESVTAVEFNTAVKSSEADVLVFIDADIVPPADPLLGELVCTAMQSKIGIVTGRIANVHGIVEQAGVVLAEDLSPSFAHNGFAADVPGNIFRNTHTGNMLAVSRSFLAIRRSLFEELKGFDESGVALFDIDLCLRVHESGMRIVVIPDVAVIRVGARHMPPEPPSGELARFRAKWARFSERDPFCNPHLKRDGSFEIDLGSSDRSPG
ncbi:MAG TPA: glycosyltransferase [Pyrinomonadaceae bacterium]|nr:glycosyltransferase [Pyrinomonadaceae bacterium]